MSRRGVGYLIAVGGGVFGVALLFGMRAFGESPGLMPLLVPVVLAAWFGGQRPGSLSVALSCVIGAIWLQTGFDAEPSDAIRLSIFALIGVVFVYLVRSRDHSQALSDSSNPRFRRIFEASPVPLSLSHTNDRRVIAVNDAYCRFFGIERADILRRTPADVGIVVVRPTREEMFARLRDGVVCDVEVTAEVHGVPRVMRVSSDVLDLDGQPYALTTFVDVTEARRAEDSARASDAQFRELAENIDQFFWVSRPGSVGVTYISPAYETILGRPVAEVYANPRAWLEAVHPDDRAIMTSSVAREDGQPVEYTYRIVRPDGAIRNIHVRLSPIRDSDGRVTRMAGVGTDITDRLRLEEQVRETQKMESMGALAGGVAHDFNNILAVIAANIGLLGETFPPGHADRELVDEIDDAVGRATALTRQLLAFSRRQVVAPVVLDLNAAIADTRKMLRRMVGEDIVIKTSLEPELAHVSIDPGYLVQVLLNLACNARDAMPRGGSLTFTTRNSGHEVILEVSDDGCGMTDDVRARALEPFFTTKDVGHGTGLGLSVVHGIVDQAGGKIEIKSAPGNGTTFRIALPAVDEPVEPIHDVAVAGAQGTEKLILLDDDFHVRTSAARALRARGYHVLEASDGPAALRLLRDHGDSIDLLISDVVLPGIDGREVAEAARRDHPALKVLYISGYTDDAVVRHGIQTAEVAFLEKPFRPHVLAGKVRQVLDQRRSGQLLVEVDRQRDLFVARG